jgi:hypothetical protein
VADVLNHSVLPPAAGTYALLNFARDFARGRRAALNNIPASAAPAINCWLDDLLVAAEQGNGKRVNKLVERINAKLQDEFAYQLNLQHCGRCCCE